MKSKRILHIGNIANNAYVNSKFLRAKSINSDVLCYDYFHVLGSPEWEEASCTGNHGNDFYPDWTKVDLEGFRLPNWFIRDYLERVDPADPKSYLSVSNSAPSIVDRLRHAAFVNLRNKWIHPKETKNEIAHYHLLISEFKKFFPKRKDQLTLNDILPLRHNIQLFKKIFDRYDLIQGYSFDCIWPMLSGFKPYIAFEHGTLRDLPFEDSAIGRLTALAYKKADLVFITNADNILAAKKLNLTNFIGIPHPIQDVWHKKWLKNQKKSKEIVIFYPSRHDWKIKGNDLAIRGLSKAIAKTKKLVKVYFINWGMEVSKSKELIKKLGFEKNTVWLNPISRKMVGFWMEHSDIVMDQFILKTMGAIAAEAMLSAKPVLISYDHQINKWLFPQKPPLVCVFDSFKIAKALLELIEKPSLREKLGKQGKIWFYKYHSEKTVTEILLKSYKKVLKY